MDIIGRGDVNDDTSGRLISGQAGYGRQRKRGQSTVITDRCQNRDEPEDGVEYSMSAAAMTRLKEIRELEEDHKRLGKLFEEWETRRRVGGGKVQVGVFEPDDGGRSAHVSVQEHDEDRCYQVRDGEKANNECKPTMEVKSEEKAGGNLIGNSFCFEMAFDLKGLGKRKREPDSIMIDDCNEESPKIKKVVIAFKSSTEFKILFEGEKSKKRIVLGGK